MYNKVVKQIRFTKKGYEKLKKEYKALLRERPLAVLDLKKARDMGDLSENGYYKAARVKLSEIDRNLRKILFELKSGVIATKSNKNTINIGSTVELSTEEKEIIYHIVGDLEADPGSFKISLLSPLGKALENKKIGDTIEINTQDGKVYYKIMNVS